MTIEFLEAAKDAIRRSAVPMTISQIRTEIKHKMQGVKVPSKDRFAAEIREGLSGHGGIYEWPEFRRSPLFASSPLAACIKEALLRALDEEPQTVTNAAKAVKKALKQVSEKQVTKEIKVLLPQHVASGTIIRLPVGRQAGIYLSRNWMAKHAQAEDGQGSLNAVIPEVVARMQSGPGNYVRVDRLRMAPEILATFDKVVMDLARAGKLVLGRYDGPRPVPENKEWAYIQGEEGNLFEGVALPRNQEA